MNNLNLGPADPDSVSEASSGRGRAKRLAATIGAGAVLLGAGAGIGVALTTGASASTGSSSGGPTAAGLAAQTSTAAAAGRCARIIAGLRNSGHNTAASRVNAFCRRRGLRLALVGGEYGQVTFKASGGTKTLAFERGTVESVSASVITIQAADGTQWSWDLGSSTRVRSDHQQVAESTLSQGDSVLVEGTLTAGTRDARLIRIRPAGQPAPAPSSSPPSSSAPSS